MADGLAKSGYFELDVHVALSFLFQHFVGLVAALGYVGGVSGVYVY